MREKNQNIKETPKITIITPSYNQGQFLRETIESVLNQDYPNFEYFIVDGKSTDDSVKIIREYNDRIDWWVSEIDQGQSDAINKGFNKATGELLCWVNSDDVMLPGCLREVADSYLKNDNPDLIHTNFMYINENSNITRMIRIPRQTLFLMYRGVWSVSAPTSFFRTTLLREAGYLNPNYSISMDLDLWMRMIKAGARIHYIPKYLGAFRFHQNSKTTITVSLKKNRGSISEHDRIMESALPGTTARSRWMWCMVWKFYQLVNLNYLRAFTETLIVKGKNWKQVFI